jgi:hypothetical protein
MYSVVRSMTSNGPIVDLLDDLQLRSQEKLNCSHHMISEHFLVHVVERLDLLGFVTRDLKSTGMRRIQACSAYG